MKAFRLPIIEDLRGNCSLAAKYPASKRPRVCYEKLNKKNEGDKKMENMNQEKQDQMEMSEAHSANRRFIAEQLAKRSKEQFPDRVVHSQTQSEIVELQRHTFGAETLVSQEDGAYPNPNWNIARRREVLDLPGIEKAISEMRPYFAKIMAKTEVEIRAIEKENGEIQEELKRSAERAAQLREQATGAILSNEKEAKKLLEMAEMETLKQVALSRKREAKQKEYEALQTRYDDEIADAAYGEWCVWEQERRRIVQETYDGIMHLYDLVQANHQLADGMGPLRRRYVGHNGSDYVYASPGLPDTENKPEGEQDKPE